MSGPMAIMHDTPPARGRRSLRRRVAVSCGTAFLFGACLFRYTHWRAAVADLERDVDLGLQARLVVLEADRRVGTDAAGATRWLPPLERPSEERRGWIGWVLDAGHRRTELDGFRWFAGAWRPDGTPVRSVDPPEGFAWDPAWRGRAGTVWTTPNRAWRLAAVERDDGTLLVAGADRAGLAAAARDEAIYQAKTFAIWVPFMLGLAWLVLGRAMEPLAEIAATARRIGRGAFGERIDLARADAEVADAADTLNRMLDRLDDIRQAQSRFNADVAHQIVNPVHAILLETAPGEGRTEADAIDALGRIDGLARRIEEVCGAMLAYSRTAALDAERLRRIDLEPIVAAAIDRVEMEAERRGIELVSPAGGAVVRGDADLLEEVVVNLLTNAAEHGSAGDRIAITLASGPEGCLLSVIDHGPGVAPGALATLFQRERSGKPHGGHGIGLALSRRIARSHGGDLVHEATPGGGATFRLLLPAPSDAPGADGSARN